MNEKQELGLKGEELANNHLTSLNYTILETNWRQGHLEVDIIATTGDIIVFCEVKTRSSNVLGNPEEFVTLQKQKNLIRAANSYVLKKNINKEVRFDIISILQKDGKTTLNHITNAFTARW